MNKGKKASEKEYCYLKANKKLPNKDYF